MKSILLRTSKEFRTPDNENYSGVSFKLTGEHLEGGDPSFIDGPASPFDDDQAEAERYCMEVGKKWLWSYGDAIDEEAETVIDDDDKHEDWYFKHF